MNPQLSRTGIAARLTDPFAFVAGRTATGMSEAQPRRP